MNLGKSMFDENHPRDSRRAFSPGKIGRGRARDPFAGVGIQGSGRDVTWPRARGETLAKKLRQIIEAEFGRIEPNYN
jgi:hypothetical protein